MNSLTGCLDCCCENLWTGGKSQGHAMTDKASLDAPPVDTTRLALERTRVAYERTMMAWVRTGTSLITFGFSVYKFFQIEMKDSIVSQTLIGPRGFGLALIGIGLLSLLLGTTCRGRPAKSSPSSSLHLVFSRCWR